MSSGQHRLTFGLPQHATMIILGIDEVNTTAGFFFLRRDDRLVHKVTVHAGTAKFSGSSAGHWLIIQRCGLDTVEESDPRSYAGNRPDKSHRPLPLRALLTERQIKSSRIGIMTWIDDRRWNFMQTRAFKRIDIRLTGNHRRQRRHSGKSSGFRGLEQRFQIAAAAGNQHGNLYILRQNRFLAIPIPRHQYDTPSESNVPPWPHPSAPRP